MASDDVTLGQKLQEQYEPRPDPQELTGHKDSGKNTNSGVDYEPHPEKSVKVSAEKERIVKSICNLYSGSASEEDMHVYAHEAVYDDPWSYCDTRYKIAGQWYGIPKIFDPSETLNTEIISPSDTDPHQIIFKLQQKYTAKAVKLSKVVNSLVSLTLDDEGKSVTTKTCGMRRTTATRVSESSSRT